MAGELDNASESKGTLLRSTVVDQQGLHRLARAQYFYESASNQANQINSPFEWELVIVPNVGHNQALMAKAASEILYE